MNARDWGRLRLHLLGEIMTILAPLEDKDWNDRSTKREANNMLAQRATQLHQELGLPSIPDGHKFRARLHFRTQQTPQGVSREREIILYHAPQQVVSRPRANNVRAARRHVSIPRPPEDVDAAFSRLIDIRVDTDRADMLEQMLDDMSIDAEDQVFYDLGSGDDLYRWYPRDSLIHLR